MIINNEHNIQHVSSVKLLVGFNTRNLVKWYVPTKHIIHTPAEARTRDLPVPRLTLYHWAMEDTPPPPLIMKYTIS